jgi:hypothetical protein
MRLFGRSVGFTASLVSVVVVAMVWPSTPGHASVALTQISSDPFTNADGQHRTEVGPSILQAGSATIFSAFQAGRSVNGGAAGVGFARSVDRTGHVWHSGFLDGVTVHRGGGSYTGVSDVAVAYHINYDRWLVSPLATGGPGGTSAVLVSTTQNGGLNWKGPYTIATGQLAKNWIVCDNRSRTFAGRCYAGYSVTNAGDALRIHTSFDRGITWGPARATADSATGLAVGRPVILRDGTVIMPYLAGNGQIRSIRSTDGGATWRSTLVATVQRHTVAGGLRSSPFPSAQLDNLDVTYVAWSDCRFRAGCAANDIVLSTTTDGLTWTAPRRVPIASTGSQADHFAPGLGVDPGSWGSETRIGLTYAYYPNANCTATTCQLNFGFISSINAGASWSAPTHLAGPMSLSWLPQTSQGRMFADTLATLIMPYGNAMPSLPVASAPSGGRFNQAMYAPAGGLPLTGGTMR